MSSSAKVDLTGHGCSQLPGSRRQVSACLPKGYCREKATAQNTGRFLRRTTRPRYLTSQRRRSRTHRDRGQHEPGATRARPDGLLQPARPEHPGGR